MTDNYEHKGMRRKLIENLRSEGIFSERVLEAMLKVPRHLFMSEGLEKLAYRDQALPIEAGQTISQPYTVAFQSNLLDVSPGQKVLEIGTGSGYQTAILLEMGAKVWSVERIKKLFDSAYLLLKKLNYNPYLFFGDGYLGLPTYGPFDRIIITAGAPDVPLTLKNQLKTGGKMVIPVGNNLQKMTLVARKSENEYETTAHGNFSFVPLLKGKK